MGGGYSAHFLINKLILIGGVKGEDWMDTESPEEKQSNIKELQSSDTSQSKSQKVQLDIEDAPFLLDTEEEAVPFKEPEEISHSSTPTLPNEQDQDSILRRKKLRKQKIFVIILSIFIIVIAISWFLFFQDVPPLEEPTLPEQTVVIVPSTEKITGPQEYKITFKPFTVAQPSGNSVKFLEATFVGISKDEKVIKESKSKELVLRDAIYYYLSNKTHGYLIDPKNTLVIKQDLLDIVNGYLISGKMEDILLENYIVK